MMARAGISPPSLTCFAIISKIKYNSSKLHELLPSFVHECKNLRIARTVFKMPLYKGADKSLARPTSHVFCLMARIFRLMLVLFYIYSTNIPPIVIVNRIHETKNLLSL